MVKGGADAVIVHKGLADRMAASWPAGWLGSAIAGGCPLLAMMYVRDGTKESEYDPAKIKHAARVAEEIGADIVKVNYTGAPESFAGVVAGVRTPVIIAGGTSVWTRSGKS